MNNGLRSRHAAELLRPRVLPQLDATYAHLFASTVTVSADTAKIPRVNPLPGNARLETVNRGTYAASADLSGLGVQVTF